MFFMMFLVGIEQHYDSKGILTLSRGILFVAFWLWCCMLAVGVTVARESLVEEEEEGVVLLHAGKHPCEGGCGANLKDCKCPT